MPRSSASQTPALPGASSGERTTVRRLLHCRGGRTRKHTFLSNQPNVAFLAPLRIASKQLHYGKCGCRPSGVNSQKFCLRHVSEDNLPDLLDKRMQYAHSPECQDAAQLSGRTLCLPPFRREDESTSKRKTPEALSSSIAVGDMPKAAGWQAYEYEYT